jgi:SAM-dependent methyltransferase
MFSIEFLHVIRQYELRSILPHLPPACRILEIGGGTGFQAKLLAEEGYEVSSIDLPTTNYRDDQVYPVIEYDGQQFPFPDNSFDVVFSSNLLEHVQDLAQLHRESARVLRKGGHAVHIMPTSAWRLWTIAAHYIEMGQRIVLEFGRCAPFQSNPQTVQSALHNVRGVVRHYAVVPRHGETGNAVTELISFSAARWSRHFHAHHLSVIERRPMRLFYTGHSVLGNRLALPARRALSRFAGSACTIWVVKFPEKCAGDLDPHSQEGGERIHV